MTEWRVKCNWHYGCEVVFRASLLSSGHGNQYCTKNCRLAFFEVSSCCWRAQLCSTRVLIPLIHLFCRRSILERDRSWCLFSVLLVNPHLAYIEDDTKQVAHLQWLNLMIISLIAIICWDTRKRPGLMKEKKYYFFHHSCLLVRFASVCPSAAISICLPSLWVY